MSILLDRPPYGLRDDVEFLHEMERLTAQHLAGCEPYARIWKEWQSGAGIEALPFLHVGLFKRLLFRTEGMAHERTLESSATTGSTPSRIVLDKLSSQLQARGVLAILKEAVGDARRPLLILDDGRSLRQRGRVSARLAAAMSLNPLATSMYFLLEDAARPDSLKWDDLRKALDESGALLVYGFTSILWLAWDVNKMPGDIRAALREKRIHFVHSGGWKKMETLRVSRKEFDRHLIGGAGAGSCVVDYYGLVEQVGVIYPLCPAGYRHVPVWADVLVRDPYTLATIEGKPGMLQLMNVLAYGAPYHSVLTEDLGRIVPGACECGRSGKRFEMLGRLAQAELRGCANV